MLSVRIFSALLTIICASSAAQISSNTSATFCLDVINGNSAAGTGVQLSTCNSKVQQDWTVSSGRLQSLGMCMQPVNGNVGNGVQLEIATCSSSTAQQWTRSGLTWVLGNTYCLDLTNGNLSSGARPQLWTCYAGNANQMWNYATTPQSTTQATTSTSTPDAGRAGFPAVVTSKSTTLSTTAKVSTSTSARTSTTSTVKTMTTTLKTTTSSKTSSASLPTGTAVNAVGSSGMCLDTIGSSTTNGVGIGLAACSSTSKTQSWSLSGGALSILGGTKCIDVPNGSTSPGTLLQLWDCFAGNANQQWVRLGNTLIYADTLCIDVPNGNFVTGQQVQIYTCAYGNVNQQWNWQIASTTIAGGVKSLSSITPIGRMYPGTSNLAAPQSLSWAATGVTATFTGSSQVAISLTMTNYPTFKVYIDNVLVKSILSTADLLPITGLDKTVAHTIRLVKSNEGDYGTAVFNGFTIDAGGTFRTPPAASTRKIEIVGDSFTTGFGNLGTVSTCAAEPQNEDSTQTYAAILASSLGAELSMVASEGWGMYSDYLGNTAHAIPVIFNESVYLDPTKIWDFTKWHADVVIINLGTNDYYQAINDNGAHFISAYLSFIQTLRTKYGTSTWIFCIAPHTSDEATALVNSVVSGIVSSRISAGDSRIQYVDIKTPVFEPSTNTGVGCQQHPNVASHTAIAQILLSSIKSATGWS